MGSFVLLLPCPRPLQAVRGRFVLGRPHDSAFLARSASRSDRGVRVTHRPWCEQQDVDQRSAGTTKARRLRGDDGLNLRVRRQRHKAPRVIDQDQELCKEIITPQYWNTERAERSRQQNLQLSDGRPDRLMGAVVDGDAIAGMNLLLLAFLQIDAEWLGELFGEARAIRAAIDQGSNREALATLGVKQDINRWVKIGPVAESGVRELRRSSRLSAPRRLREFGQVLRGRHDPVAPQACSQHQRRSDRGSLPSDQHTQGVLERVLPRP
jgi:hypothetical protein